MSHTCAVELYANGTSINLQSRSPAVLGKHFEALLNAGIKAGICGKGEFEFELL
jgi:hypothetical protein